MANKTTDKSRAGKAAREKGARWERTLAKIFEGYGFNTHRGYVQFKQSDVIGLPGIHVEAKAVEKLNMNKAMEQAENESKKRKDGFPAVFHKQRYKRPTVTMYLEDWVKLYLMARGKQEGES